MKIPYILHLSERSQPPDIIHIIPPLHMKREFPEVPLVGVGAIIIEDARVLLVKRAHPPLQAQWSIPGGVLEVGELIREAAVREAREETGLIVEPEDLLGELLAASDAAEVRWFAREELAPLKLAEDTIDVIRKGFATLGTE